MAGKPQQQTEPEHFETPSVPMMIGWPVVGVCGVFTVAGIFQAANLFAGPLSPWWLALVGGLATLIGAKEARTFYTPRLFGNAQADLAAGVSTAIGLATTWWLVWSAYRGVVDTWAHLILIGLVATMLWWALLWNGQRVGYRDDPAEPEPDDTDIPWQALLSKIDDGKHAIVEMETHRAGVALVCHPRAELAKVPTYDEFKGLAKPFSSAVAMEVRRRGSRLPLNAVRTEPGRDDAEFRMAVTMRNVFQGSPAYLPDYTPGDITKALDLGEYEDASRILISLLASHTQIVGATGSGKSVLANNMIARISGCANALVWIAATDKLIPLVWPWLRCYFEGRTEKPAIDWVAGMRPRRVLEMLATAYALCCERNSRLADESKLRATASEPALIIFMEEVSHAVESREKIECHDGRMCTISDLIAIILRTGRSANVRLVLMAQSALNEAFGDRAAVIKRQLGNRICLRTNEPYDGYRTLNGLAGTVNTTQLTDFTMLVQFIPEGEDIARAVPGKAALLDGTNTIAHIAVRNASWRPDIEPDSDMGPYYPQRWDPDYCADLARVVERAERKRQQLVELLDQGKPLPDGEDEPGPALHWRTPGPNVFRPADPTPPPQPEPAPPVSTHTDDVTPEGDTLYRSEPPQEAYDAMFSDLIRHFRVAEPPRPKPTRDLPPERRESVLGLPRPQDTPLFKTLDDIIANPAGVEPGQPEPPLPEPIDKIRDFLRELRQREPMASFVLTDELAQACAVNSRSMGQAIRRHLHVESEQARADQDPQRRRGYSVRKLEEAITRKRFDL